MCRSAFILFLFVACVAGSSGTRVANSCCSVAREGAAVVNADQTVLMLWNPVTNTQHFIRQASFKSDVKDVGFLVPSPSKPELAESSNDAFIRLADVTKPEIIYKTRSAEGMGCGCGDKKTAMSKGEVKTTDAKSVEVLEQKRVAGFDASVLRADDGDVLVEWLKTNGYDYSPAVAEWAKPYIEQKWLFTALKVAPKDDAGENAKRITLDVPALRISFTTDKPLFPYREPKSAAEAEKLRVAGRMLRIFFVGDQRMQGAVAGQAWNAQTAWTNALEPKVVTALLDELKLPADAVPAKPWLTEFEDPWKYDAAAGDLYFSPSVDQSTIARPPIIVYQDANNILPRDITVYAVVAVVLWPVLRRRKRVTA
ncbi:MAG: DUF2330 domain-containing protein [Pirellulales bacterium]